MSDPSQTSRDLLRDLLEAQRESQHSVDLHRGRITAETGALQKQVDAVNGVVSKSADMLHLLAPQVQEHDKRLDKLAEKVAAYELLAAKSEGAIKMVRWLIAAIIAAPALWAGWQFLAGKL